MTAESDLLLILWLLLHWLCWNTFATIVNFVWALAWFCVPVVRARLSL
jgi:hypothetical protein